jgi:hypothetical protein
MYYQETSEASIKEGLRREYMTYDDEKLNAVIAGMLCSGAIEQIDLQMATEEARRRHYARKADRAS